HGSPTESHRPASASAANSPTANTGGISRGAARSHRRASRAARIGMRRIALKASTHGPRRQPPGALHVGQTVAFVVVVVVLIVVEEIVVELIIVFNGAGLRILFVGHRRGLAPERRRAVEIAAQT